jgi:hypothetical protein
MARIQPDESKEREINMGKLESKITITTAEYRPCWVNGRKALFHRWVDTARPAKPREETKDAGPADHFQLYSVQGLVEYEDGTVARVWPQDIQFADIREEFEAFDKKPLPFTFSDEEAPQCL